MEYRPEPSGRLSSGPLFLGGCGNGHARYDPPRPKSSLRVFMPVDVPEIIEVDDTRVACDGGGGALGHPRVYLEMGDENFVECPYCDRRFVLREGVGAHH